MKKVVFISRCILILVLPLAFAISCSEISSIPSIEAITVDDVSGCDANDGFPGKSRFVKELVKGKSGYFPSGIFYQGYPTADDFKNDWYGRHLTSVKEESLLDIPSQNLEVYRFIWLRSFHHPVIIRIQASAREMSLLSYETSGYGGSNAGDVTDKGERPISLTEWCTFKGLLATAGYWKLPTVDDSVQAQDGARWIVEGLKESHYHVVDRQSGSEVFDAGVYLLQLSGRNIRELGDDLY